MFRSLDESSVKLAHLRITALSSGGNFLDGYDISIISVAILFLPSVFPTSGLYYYLIIGSTLIGMVFGGVFGGYLTDRSGRKFIYLWDMLFFIIFTILTAFSTGTIELVLSRLFLGVAIGADYAISPTIVAEYSPVKHRGKLLTVNGLSWFVGAAISYLAGSILAPLGADSWRYMFLLGVIPATLVLLLRRSVPESPRWLIEHGRPEDARSSAKQVVGELTIEDQASIEKLTFRDLFGPRYRKATLFVMIFWFILDSVTYVIALLGPSILTTLNLTHSGAAFTAFLISLVAIIGAVATFLVIDWFGRKRVTTMGFLGMSASLLAGGLALIYGLGLIAFVVILMVVEVSQEFGPGITNSIYPQELYPTSIRATAQGFGTTISRLGAVVGIFGFGTLASSLGYGTGMILLAIVSFVGLLTTLILGIETKGKSLEELTS